MCIGRVLKLTDEQSKGQILPQQLRLRHYLDRCQLRITAGWSRFFQPSCLRVKEITLYPCHFVSS